MRRSTLISSLALVFLSAMVLFGCSSDNPTNVGTSDELNLTAEFGGYTAEDEAIAFGDADIAELAKDDPAFVDPIFSAADFDSVSNGAKVYALAIRWGMLDFDSTVTAVTDWSGTLQLKHGYVYVHRTLLFEGGDSTAQCRKLIVRPRPDRQTVEWVSNTTVSFDGLLLAIIVPPTPEGEDWSDNELVFNTAPYSRTFAISELEELDELIDVDNLGNQISFVGRDLDLAPCGTGNLDGRWILNPSGKNGHLFGRWMSEDGVVLGFLHGHFGDRPEGNKVFFGKIISLDGSFRGFMRGVWGIDPSTTDNAEDAVAEGWFDGIWAGRDGLPVGRLSGHWGSAMDGDSTAVIVDDPSNGNGNADDHRKRDPREHPVYGARHDVAGFFAGTWTRVCEADSTASE